MKTSCLSTILAAALGVVITSLSATAQTTFTTATSGPYAGDVINSTFTFGPLGANVTGFTAVLEQTQIPQNTLNGIIPPAQFELELTSLTYVDTQNLFNGTGAPLQINVSFSEQPNIQQGGQPTAMVTLVSTNSYTGNVQASSQNPITFTLANPVIFPLSDAQNLGNIASVPQGQPLGTWQDSVSNIHAVGQGSSTVGGTTFFYNLNGTFSGLGGTLEVIYAAPEPNSGWLALLAGIGIAGLALVRCRGAKSA